MGLNTDASYYFSLSMVDDMDPRTQLMSLEVVKVFLRFIHMDVIK